MKEVKCHQSGSISFTSSFIHPTSSCWGRYPASRRVTNIPQECASIDSTYRFNLSSMECLSFMECNQHAYIYTWLPDTALICTCTCIMTMCVHAPKYWKRVFWNKWHGVPRQAKYQELGESQDSCSPLKSVPILSWFTQPFLWVVKLFDIFADF